MTKGSNKAVPRPSTPRVHTPYWGNNVDDDGLVEHLMRTESQFLGDVGVFMYHAAPGPIQLGTRAAAH